VYVVGEFSASGKAAVEGRDYRGFSPTFFTDAEIPAKPLAGKQRIEIPTGKVGSADKPAQIVCNEYAGLNFGGLVNEPAFKEISPLWAKHAGATSDEQHNQQEQDEMKKTIAELQAAKANLENQVRALEAKAQRTEIENAQLDARRAELHSAEQDVKIAELEAKEVERRTSDADAAVKRAVERLALPAQNTELQAKWKTNCANNPEMIAVLDQIPGVATALTARATQTATAVEFKRGQIAPKEAAKALVELQAKNVKVTDMREKLAHAKEIHALYAKEIRGNDLFLEMPLEAAVAADTVGTLAGTLVAQRAIELYKYQFPVLGMITTDYSDQPANYNQTTTTRIITVPAIMTYSATIGSDGKPAGWVIGTPAATTDVSVTLNNHKGVEIMFDANVLASTARRLFDEQAEAQAYALGKDLVDALYAVFTAANYADNAAFTEASVDFGRRTFSKVSRIFNNQGVPFTNRFALINSTYFEKLEQDPTLTSLAVYQKPEILTDSRLPQLSRFTPIEAPNLPTTGNMAAFFGHKSSAMVQSRLPNDYTTILPGASYGQVQAVTNPDTGVSALLVNYVNHAGAYASSRLAWMYGVAKAATKGGQIVKSA